MTNLPFENPYHALTAADRRRLTTDIHVSDWRYIKGIFMHDGVWNVTLNTLLVKLIHELKKRNITDWTSIDAFKHFVANCSIAGPEQLAINSADIVPVAGPNSTTLGIVSHSDASNDGRTIAKQNSGNSDAPHLTSNLPSGVAKRSRRGSKSKNLNEGESIK